MTSKELKAKAAANRELRSNTIEICGTSYSKQDACKMLADIMVNHYNELNK